MPAADFVLGMLMFVAVGAAAALVAGSIVRRWLADLDLLDGAVAFALLFVTAVVAIHLLPLSLGVLSRGTALVAAALAAAAGALIWRGRTDDDADVVTSRAWRADSRPAYGLAAITSVITIAAALADLRRWLPQGYPGVDTNSFHLPNAARLVQNGSMWQVDQFLPLQAQGYYPHHGELLDVWAMLPVDNDFLVRWVVVAVLAAWAVAIVAAVREAGGSAATAALCACALVTIPIVGVATVPRAMPDAVAYFGVTAALLFLMRRRRTPSRANLVMAGLGLGLALGTKWYGLPAALVGVGVWAAYSARAAWPRWRDSVPGTALLAAVTFASGGIWMVRNLLEVGNPIYPAKVAPLGITIFDAPRDVVTERVGFSIADYAGDPPVLGAIAGEIYQGAGPLPFVAAVLAIATAAVAWRRRSAGAAALAAGAALLALAYTLIPTSALGTEGHPDLARFNTRYLVPAVICAVVGGAWVARDRGPRVLLQITLAVVTLISLPDAYGPLRERSLALGLVALAAVGLAAYAAWRALRGRSRPPVAAVAALAAAVAIAGGWYVHRTEQRLNAARYNDADPAFVAIDRLGDGQRVVLVNRWSLAGVPPVWPSFGRRMRNRVEYAGRFERGMLVPVRSEQAYRRFLREERPGLVVVGTGTDPGPRVRQEGWTRRAGFVPVTRSPRLVLYARPRLAARLRDRSR